MKSPRNFWPLGITLAFVIFFGGMASFVVIACSHRDSLVNANYYEQELKFQNQIDGAARAQKAGAVIQFDAAKKLVAITVPPAQLAHKFSGTIELYSPVDPKADREFPFEPRADGTQTLDVSTFTAGSWSVRARWTVVGETYFIEQKIKI